MSYLNGPTSGRCSLIFNPDKNKQAIQVIFSQRKDSVIHPHVFVNGSEVAVKSEHKHLGMILDSKLNFESHIREVINQSQGRYRSHSFFIQICITRCSGPDIKTACATTLGLW